MLVRRAALQSALAAVTADDTRYFLDAVQIRPDGSVEATNGHLCVIAKDPDPIPDSDFPVTVPPFNETPAGPVLIPSSVIRGMIAAMPKKARITIPALDCVQIGRNGSPTSIQLAATDLQSAKVATVEQDPTNRFPELARVVPAAGKSETVPVVFSAEVLEAIIKAAKTASAGSPSHRVYIRLEIPTDQAKGVISAVRFSSGSSNGVQIEGAAMPCRA